jgi:hypothetical protein
VAAKQRLEALNARRELAQRDVDIRSQGSQVLLDGNAGERRVSYELSRRDSLATAPLLHESPQLIGEADGRLVHARTGYVAPRASAPAWERAGLTCTVLLFG